MSETSSTTSTETAPIRRLVVNLTIGSFSLAALMGVIALLGGGSFGEREGQILLTTLITGTTSLAMLCYLATAGTRFQPVGVVGGIVVLLPFVTSLLLLWGDDWGDGLLRIFGVGVTVAATLAQVSLLLALAGSRARVRLVLWATIALAAAVAAITSGMIVAESGSDGGLRLLGVLAILDVLGTVITVALALFGNRGADEPGASVRIPARLEQQIAEAASNTGTTRDQVVAEALDRYFAEPTRTTGQSEVTR
jgi:hypothetical protein